jgi:hypothetical protein
MTLLANPEVGPPFPYPLFSQDFTGQYAPFSMVTIYGEIEDRGAQTEP